jgi:hypothetical protein
MFYRKHVLSPDRDHLRRPEMVPGKFFSREIRHTENLSNASASFAGPLSGLSSTIDGRQAISIAARLTRGAGVLIAFLWRATFLFPYRG